MPNRLGKFDEEKMREFLEGKLILSFEMITKSYGTRANIIKNFVEKTMENSMDSSRIDFEKATMLSVDYDIEGPSLEYYQKNSKFHSMDKSLIIYKITDRDLQVVVPHMFVKLEDFENWRKETSEKSVQRIR